VPDEFVRWIFPALVAHRRPKYEALAARHGYTLDARRIESTTNEDDLLELVASALASGSDVLFFPEGTFVAATGLRPFRLGAFMAAARAGAPVLPLALRGTRRVLRGDGGLPRPGPISLHVGEPVEPAGTDMAALVTLRAEVMDQIAAHCGEPRLDLVAAGPARPPLA